MKCEPFWPTPRLPSLLHPSRGGLGPTLFPRLRRRQRIRRVLRAPGRGARGARPSRVSGPAPPARSAPPRPAPDASWGGLLEAPGRRDSTAEPQGYGSCFRATRRALFCRRESALPAPPVRRSPKRAPRAGAGRGPGCGAVRLEPAP